MSDDTAAEHLYPDDLPGAGENENPLDQESPSAPESPDSAPTDGSVPEKYELELKGLQLDQSLVSEAEPIFRELGLSNKQANALLPIAPKLMDHAQATLMDQMIAAGDKQRKAWLDAFVGDPHIGGARRAESESLAAKGMAAMGFGKDHPFRKALNETGFGNHPDMIRMLRWIGSKSGSSPAAERPAWSKLYPDD